jgi:hypothetical protein
MGRHVIDTRTTELLLDGSMGPSEAPPAYAEVARLLQATRAPAAPDELIREEETVAAMVAVVGSGPLVVVPDGPAIGPKDRVSILRRPKRLALVILAASLATTLALALARLLPGPAQDFFHRIAPGVPAPPTGDTMPGPGAFRVSPPEGLSAPEGLSPGVSVVAPKAVPTLRRENQEVERVGGGGPRAQTPARYPDRRPRHHEPTEPQPEPGTLVGVEHGLCHAYFQGQGGVKGGKWQARAFERLASQAEAGEQTVAEYCGATAGSEQAAHHSAKNNEDLANGKARGKAKAQDKGKGRGKSKGKAGPSTPGGGRGKRDSGPGSHQRSDARSSHASRTPNSAHGHHKK